MTRQTLKMGYLQNEALILNINKKLKLTIEPTLVSTYMKQIKSLEELNKAIDKVLWELYSDSNIVF